MKLTDYIKKLIRNYFTIFGIIVICITISHQIFLPNSAIGLKDIYIYMICSLVVDLLELIFYSPKEISEKEMQIRRFIHFIVLEVVLLIFVNVIGFVNGILDIIVLEVQIAVIYALGRFLSWMNDKKTSKRINEKLNTMKEELGFEQEEE